jgi:hypothetical protein
MYYCCVRELTGYVGVVFYYDEGVRKGSGMMMAASSSETSVSTYQTTLRRISDNRYVILVAIRI